MAVDYKRLNRQQDWNVQQKAALKKVFQAFESAATGSDSALCSRTIIHNAMSGHFDGDFKHDVQQLGEAFRTAVDAQDNAASIVGVMSSFRAGGNKRRVLRLMADEAITQIV